MTFASDQLRLKLTGKVTIKVEPFPGVLLAVIVPAWRSTIFLQIADSSNPFNA
jgi:hypothetical protein